ncbi:ABC transporter ATP-binding protein [Catellatospora citrea]|uniref:Multidrug ABC transporter ATPase n=1 Tax=Catellatospora citrea TaxID=53366 RepID=A0A8J3P063_9ACTN|nr:ABC transporter ATP-binding protein [Catellatospora citrea]RKE10479.1 ABC-2 type transport system ATP-binding protein [Catellatospora citrea]GIF99012.1 multidrug ABC transporter ATPase [Catellatospora citrea]
MDGAVTTTGLTKRYGQVVAVDDLALRVRPGEIYALLGLNGAGKTTTIRVLLGMVKPTAGIVTVLGRPVATTGHDLWAEVGYLVETPSAYPDLTVRDNLRLIARLRRLPGTGLVDDVIDRLGLAPYADRRAGKLSLGNAQRLGLAKALLHRPRLLILDEPANGLDPAGVVEIRGLLRELATTGTTILLSSHLLAEVARLADRIGILHDGRLLRELDADQLAAEQRRTLTVAARDLDAAATALRAAGHLPTLVSDRLLLSDPDAVDHPDAVATALVSAGCPPTRLVVEHEDLETYFLRLTGQETT